MKTNKPEIIQEEKKSSFKMRVIEFVYCRKNGHNRNKSNTIYRQSRYCSTCHKHISLW